MINIPSNILEKDTTIMASEQSGSYVMPTTGNSSSDNAIDGSFSLDSEIAKQFIMEKGDIAEILKLMAFNQTYLELMDQLVIKLDVALMQNRNAQTAIKNKLSPPNSNSRNDRRHPTMSFPCWPPYFKDSSGMVPAQNQEAMEFSRICFNDPLMEEDKKWKDNELNLLTRSVAYSLKEQQTIQLEAKRDIIAIKLRTAGMETSDEQMKTWRSEIERIRQRIKYIRERPVEDLIQEANRDFSRVDWAKISASEFQGSRSITQLKQKWCNDLVYNNEPWTEEEDARLFDLAKDGIHCNEIVQLLGTDRSPYRCFERNLYLQESQKEPKPWTPEEDQRLRRYVHLLKIGEEIPWAKISMYMEGRSKIACEYRYNRSLNENLRHGRWTQTEDMLLLSAVNKYGPQNWNRIAENVNGRSSLQCRDRWIHVLDFKRRDLPWGWEEHQRLLYGVRLFGRDECAKIAKLIPGRNNMDVRMRIRLLVKYKIEETEKPRKKIVFRHFANNYIFCKMRRKSVIEEFTKYLETEKGKQQGQMITRLGLGEYVARAEIGIGGIDYTHVKKERSDQFGHWKIMGSGRWVKVLQKNPNEYDEEDLRSELDKLPDVLREEAIEWLRESDKRLELERLQENDIPDDPVEAKEFYERIYPQDRLMELSEQVGELLPPRPREIDYYHRYKKRPPKIRVKKLNGKRIAQKRKYTTIKKRPKIPKKLLEKLEAKDLEGLKWSERMMLEVNNYLAQLPKGERREYLIRSLCNSIRLRVHHANLAMIRSTPDFKDKAFRLMTQYVAQILEDPPAPIPIKPAIREERENSVVLPNNWQQMSLKEMMQYKIAPTIYPVLAKQAQQQNEQKWGGEPENNSMELVSPLWKNRKRRRHLVEKPMQGLFKDRVICPLPNQAMWEHKFQTNCIEHQKIFAKLLPPCPGTVNAMQLLEGRVRNQLMRGAAHPRSDHGTAGPSEQSDGPSHLHSVPDKVRQSTEYALLKKRMYRLFFLPMIMQKAAAESRNEMP